MWCDDIFKIAGKVKIPRDKKNEMNECVLRVLDRCGIRKTEKITIAEKEVTVVVPAVPDADGLVVFDYSIFEKQKHEAGSYNMNTCELSVSDRGYSEYCMAMTAIMVLQEAFTGGGCYVMSDGKPMHLGAYQELLEWALGKAVSVPGRAMLWDMLLFFRRSGEYKKITADDIWDSFLFCGAYFDTESVFTILELRKNKIIDAGDEVITDRADIREANPPARITWVYKILRELIGREKERLESFLKELLASDIDTRRKMSERADEYGIIAEISLYTLSPRLVLAYAQATGTEFWTAWDLLGAQGYDDIIREPETEQKEKKPRLLPFYQATRRKSEDEFLEFWDGGNLKLSQKMEDCISDWKERYTDTEVVTDVPVEKQLLRILNRLDVNGCRYADKGFVEEFLEHGGDVAYARALALFNDILDKDAWYFPELTADQANDCVLRHFRSEFDRTAMSAFQSLLANRGQRHRIFGF